MDLVYQAFSRNLLQGSQASLLLPSRVITVKDGGWILTCISFLTGGTQSLWNEWIAFVWKTRALKNLVPTCLSSSIFTTFLHSSKNGRILIHAMHLESSGAIRNVVLFHVYMSISYQYSYPKKAALSPPRSGGLTTTVQPSKALNISYFKSSPEYWSLVDLESLHSGPVLEVSLLGLSMPKSCQMGWEGARDWTMVMAGQGPCGLSRALLCGLFGALCTEMEGLSKNRCRCCCIKDSSGRCTLLRERWGPPG